MIIENSLVELKIINIKNMKPASQKYLCPDIKLGVCYYPPLSQ